MCTSTKKLRQYLTLWSLAIDAEVKEALKRIPEYLPTMRQKLQQEELNQWGIPYAKPATRTRF